MEAYLIYIGKAAMAAAAFYLAFLLLFQNQKQFVFNRLYLPVSFAFSFIIPLITFTSVKYVESIPVFDLNGFAYLPDSALAVEQAQFVPAWYHYLFALYVLGSLLFLFRLIIGHLKALSMVVRSHIQQLFGIEVHVTPADVHPFSFFSKIVVSEKTLDSPNLQMIVEHENIHVREKHTLDILFVEILFLVQWFNPFAWLLKDAVNNNLEYLTDDQITQSHNPKDYQLAMVALADKKGVAPFLNALNGSQLKNRIIMMKKKTENKYSILKQLVVLPLLAVLVMGLSNKEVKTEYIRTAIKDSVRIIGMAKIEKETKVSGTVTAENGKPLAGVAVLEKGTNSGTITDNDGKFKLLIDHKAETLIFTLEGFETMEIAAGHGESQVIETELKVTRQSKPSEIKVVGYATGDKTKQPLFVVDGKETENIETILPENIEKMEVLKDKKATITYGDKGKNGVVLITTKTARNITKADDIQVIGYGTHFKSANNNGLGFDFGSFSEVDPTGAPLYIVDGIEIISTKNIAPDNIESISVLKNKSATDIYGEKGKNGVVLITTKTKKPENEISGNPLVIVDGKEFSGNVNDLPADEISSMNVIKDKENTKMYGEKAKDGVIVINTKTKYNSDKAEPLIVVNGKESDQKVNDIAPETIQSINVLKDEKATLKYGDKGKNGVIEITLKNAGTNNEINSILSLRQSIARNIKYPVEAQINNQTGIVEIWAYIQKDGTISRLTDKSSEGKIINIDEVVVTSLKSEKTVTSEKGNDLELLVKESKRVIGKLSPLNIPEFAGETVCFRIRFELE